VPRLDQRLAKLAADLDDLAAAIDP
jgi:hypothetical protein